MINDLATISAVNFFDGFFLAAILFFIGIIGILVRKNIIFILISLEILVNAVSLAFITAGARWGQADGQVMYIFIITMAAAEMAVALALVIQVYHHAHSTDIQQLNTLRD